MRNLKLGYRIWLAKIVWHNLGKNNKESYSAFMEILQPGRAEKIARKILREAVEKKESM